MTTQETEQEQTEAVASEQEVFGLFRTFNINPDLFGFAALQPEEDEDGK